MTKIPVKYCLGNDIGKDEMSVCFSQMDGQQRVSIKGSTKFGNNLRGWKALQTWIGRFRKQAEVPLVLVVEASGVYYEGFAYYFKEQGFDLHVLLPNKAKHYARSLNIKTKNDEVDARMLAQMGLERHLKMWRGMSPTMLKIKQLCRQRHALQQTRTAVSNQLHAHTHAHQPLAFSKCSNTSHFWTNTSRTWSSRPRPFVPATINSNNGWKTSAPSKGWES